MGKIKSWLKQNNHITGYRIFLELRNEFKILSTHLGAFSYKKNKYKFEADITIRIHAIEKGLALPNPRVGFGEKKVAELLQTIEDYNNRFGDLDFISHLTPVLDSYFKFNKDNGHCNKQLSDVYKEVKHYSISQNSQGGTISLSKKEILQRSKIDFGKFINSRYSIRDFSDTPVDKELILNAIQIAKKTPSACNRQAWKVYVFSDKIKKQELLDWQGNRGFTENIDTAIVVACSLNAFFINEMHQAYIDGGLYAMTLIYALHSQGLGTIPLTMGMMSSKMNKFYEKFNIPKEIVPILIIGVGNLKDNFKVAISERKDIKSYVEFI
nr:nitroreductase family protein [uncultured Draconibacterium sp.]